VDVSKHARVLRAQVVTAWENLGSNETSPNLRGKYFDAIKYQLEATIRLRRWDELDQLFDVSIVMTTSPLYLTDGSVLLGMLEIRS
jgi:hypothetical protein